MEILFAFIITLLAGLSTGVGGALAVIFNKPNTKVIAIALGFSAGIMIYVSMVELFLDARENLIFELGNVAGGLLAVCSFFAGMLLIIIIDKLVPLDKALYPIKQTNCNKNISNYSHSILLKNGMLTAIAVGIHNFPEGMATLFSTVNNTTLGITIALAIAIHNIPEGIAVSVPIYCATGSKIKAFTISSISGLAEPLGALIGYAILYRWMDEVVLGILFAIVAGIMVFVALDKLLPTAREYGEHNLSINGLIAGMIVMAYSLVLF